MLEVKEGVPLGPLTTLRIGGPARALIETRSAEELVETVRAVDAAGEPLLVLAGGSNVVIADAGFDGTVVRIADSGHRQVGERDGRVLVEAAAGEQWDGFVTAMVAAGLAGIDALSGIPGTVGATPIQNVGAYGQEVSSTIESVRVFDRGAGAERLLTAQECRFGYRTSALRQNDSLVVLAVCFSLAAGGRSPAVYAQLAGELGIEPGQEAEPAQVREAVLALRRAKGMVLDDSDHDTWSAGSFFTNPVLTAAQFEALAARAAAAGLGEPPRFEAGEEIKSSAAWCIERAGFSRGESRGPVALSSKHALAITNRGGATATELLAFAREIAGRVEELLGVELWPEPVLVGLDW